VKTASGCLCGLRRCRCRATRVGLTSGYAALLPAFRLVTCDRRRTLLPGVSTRLRPPSGYTDVKQGREAVATDLSAAMDPGAGEAAARRCSSVTVKDEGLCQTSVHRPIRSDDGIGFGRFSRGLRSPRQVLPSAKARAALSHRTSSGYADVKQHGEAAESLRSPRVLALVRRRPGGSRPP
jgi:hypothetical protein